MHRFLTRLAVVTATLVALVCATAAYGSAAEAAPRYVRMSSTEISYARSVLSLLNDQRAESGLSRLKLARSLGHAAAGHNQAMARVNQASHQLEGERDFAARIRAAGWKPRCAGGENIGMNGDLSREGALQLLSMMYAEQAPNDGHRRNILNPRFNRVGIAVLVDERNDRLWLTMDFAQRRC